MYMQCVAEKLARQTREPRDHVQHARWELSMGEGTIDSATVATQPHQCMRTKTARLSGRSLNWLLTLFSGVVDPQVACGDYHTAQS